MFLDFASGALRQLSTQPSVGTCFIDSLSPHCLNSTLLIYLHGERKNLIKPTMSSQSFSQGSTLQEAPETVSTMSSDRQLRNGSSSKSATSEDTREAMNNNNPMIARTNMDGGYRCIWPDCDLTFDGSETYRVHFSGREYLPSSFVLPCCKLT